jgi:nucleosome binding factor SPN SPT16 subunit
MPTTECLVHLSDAPFLVVTLNDIEIASLERVQFGLKQFDMVLIFKDFTKSPLHINSIPSTQLDDVKNWLEWAIFVFAMLRDSHLRNSSVDIPLSEGPVNLNWGPIMKVLNDSPYDFFQQGGWSFLGGSAGGEEVSAVICDSVLSTEHALAERRVGRIGHRVGIRGRVG